MNWENNFNEMYIQTLKNDLKRAEKRYNSGKLKLSEYSTSFEKIEYLKKIIGEFYVK